MTWPPSTADQGYPSAPPVGADGLKVGGAVYPSAPPVDWPTYAPGPLTGAGFAGAPSSFEPTPPAPDEQPSKRPMVLSIVGIAVVVLLAAIGVGILVRSNPSDDELTGGPTTVDLSDPAITAPPSEEPLPEFAPPSMPDLQIPDLPGSGNPEDFAQPLDAVLPDLVDFVERTRGREFVTAPTVEAVSASEFEQKLLEASSDPAAAAEMEAASITGVALGLLPPGTDLAEVAGEAGASSVLGFYDHSTKELYVKGDVITPFVQMIIVHELTHALDDQTVDLSRIEELSARDDESGFAFLALVEGTASFVQDAFRAQMSADETAALAAEELQLGFDQMESLFDLPVAYMIQSQIPYVSGQRFVDALVDRDGTAGIDAAYAEPPTTGEQILDPARYFEREPAVEVPPVRAEGPEADSGAFGAADLRLLEAAADPIGAFADPNIGLLDPVEGFGGGRFVSWENAGQACVRVEMVGDDAAGSVTIQEIAMVWADAHIDAEVSMRPAAGGIDTVVLDRCS